MKTVFKERGAAYLEVHGKIQKTLLLQPEAMITVREGVDELCHQCLNCVDGRCASPLGNEDQVRKWDAILLLKELGLPFGSCMTSAEWRALIERKFPFIICQKCRWRQECRAGEILS